MEFGKFIRECYLRSVPSVDLDQVTSDNPVNCSKHTLAYSEYDKILEEFGVNQDHNLQLACNMWMLQSGPLLVDDRKTAQS